MSSAKYNKHGERLNNKGFRLFTKDEEYIATNLGLETLQAVINQSFEYTCLEAEVIEEVTGEKIRGTSVFNDMCNINRSSHVSSFADILNKWYQLPTTKPNQTLEFVPLPREQVLKYLYQKYKVRKLEDDINL